MCLSLVDLWIITDGPHSFLHMFGPLQYEASVQKVPINPYLPTDHCPAKKKTGPKTQEKKR